MPIHKLAEGPITITVAAVETVQGNYGAQVKFTSVDGTDVYISELSATKQLARLNITPESSIGETLHFEQVKKNGTTYTNVSKANPAMAGAAPKVAPAGTTTAYAPAPKQSIGELAVLYSECVRHAMVTLGAACEEAGIPVDASAIQAAAATLFIKATR